MTRGIDEENESIIVPYETNGATPKARLFVSEGDSYVRIPILNEGIETHVRKGGPADVTRLTEVQVAREWQGVDFSEYIDAFDPSARDVYDEAHVQYYDETLEEYVTAHQGFVQATGGVGTEDPNNSEPRTNALRIRVRDPAMFFDVIDASETFRDASVIDVIEYVRDEFVASQPLWDEVNILTRGLDSEEGVGGTYVPPIPYALDVRSLLEPFTDIRSPKTFTRNRDTLRDVITWIVSRTEARLFFGTQDDGGLALVYDERPTTASFEATNLDGNVRVRENNALYEIHPRNALRYEGRSKSSLASLGDFELTLPSEKYPAVEVVHEPTERRAGERFYGRTVEGEATTLDEAIRAARSTLKEELDTSSGGKIACDVTPTVRPFTTIEATPACNGDVETDVPSYTYEVEEVTHVATATEGARTDLRVSPHVAMDDITVETREMKQK